MQLALTLVFVETKKGADALENWLCRSGFPAIAIHGDKVQMVSTQNLLFFCFIFSIFFKCIQCEFLSVIWYWISYYCSDLGFICYGVCGPSCILWCISYSYSHLSFIWLYYLWSVVYSDATL
jgi:hypothetical protein